MGTLTCRGPERVGVQSAYDLNAAGAASPEEAAATTLEALDLHGVPLTRIGLGDESAALAYVRDGRTVAVAHVLRTSTGGWVSDYAEACCV